MDENMENISYDLGSFQKLLNSPIDYFHDNNGVEKFKCLEDESQSCVTALELKSCFGVNSGSNSETDGGHVYSEITTTQEKHEQKNEHVGCRSMAMNAVEEADGTTRKKRKRVKVMKKSEEVESQRMTHIEVERNRRKQMNDHLSVLRSLIPDSYVLKGDQASIIGGAIDLVKELEQVVQSLQMQKMKKESDQQRINPTNCLNAAPQQTSSGRCSHPNTKYTLDTCIRELRSVDKSTIISDIEVTLIETHASIKILSRKRSRQLLSILAALESLHLTTLHLNITTMDQTVMFSFNAKMEDECRLTSANEIAEALHQILRIVHTCDHAMHIR